MLISGASPVTAAAWAKMHEKQRGCMRALLEAMSGDTLDDCVNILAPKQAQERPNMPKKPKRPKTGP